MKPPRRPSAWIPALLVLGVAACRSTDESPQVADEGPQEAEDAAESPDDSAIEWLFVQTATSGSFDGKTLTLRHVPPALMFSDRPYHIAGHMKSSELLAAWGEGTDSFAADPPDAVLSTFMEDGSGQPTLATVVLSEPRLEGDAFSYSLEIVEGNVPPSFGGASLFIDNWVWGWGWPGSGEYERYDNPTYVPAPPPKFNKDDGYLSYYRHEASENARRGNVGGPRNPPQQGATARAQGQPAPRKEPGGKRRAAPPDAETSKEITNRFRELKRLHQQGLISDEEFEKSKNELLRGYTDGAGS